ncbi:MAG: DUF3445 domain-containing protein [Nitratireductor sp.]|nr:DUF3445 domain-containing protein [Nitratireductor sp.]
MSMAHIPYDGSHPLFRIGLAPLEIANWIEVDGNLAGYLDEKDRLNREMPEKVFAAETGTLDAQQEVLDLIANHVCERFPQTYRREADMVSIEGTGRVVHLAAPGTPPLLTAAILVQEDLVLMRKGEQGWRLAAASLCFPSSWRLSEKFGLALADVHGPVPEFGRGSRNAMMIYRIFDNLQVELPVWRMNWSLYSDDALYHADRSGEHIKRLGKEGRADISFIRVEYQTLRKLPKSGDILFTIRIHVDPLAVLDRHPDKQRIAAGFIHSLMLLDAAQLAYKGLAGARESLVSRLREIECS